MQNCAHLVELEKCCQTYLLNYFLAKFRFDTAENEPAKNLQNSTKKNAEFDELRPGPEASPALRSASSTWTVALARPAGTEPWGLDLNDLGDGLVLVAGVRGAVAEFNEKNPMFARSASSNGFLKKF